MHLVQDEAVVTETAFCLYFQGHRRILTIVTRLYKFWYKDHRLFIREKIMSLSRVLLVLVFAACIALLLKAGSFRVTHYLDDKIDNQITRWADGK